MKKLPNIQDMRRWVLDFHRDVIRMMRLKFILTAMGILIVVFLIMLSSINMIMKTVSQSQSMRLLEQIAASDRYDRLDNMPPEAFDGIKPPDAPEPMETTAAKPAAYSGDGGVAALSWVERDWDDGQRQDPRPPEWDGDPDNREWVRPQKPTFQNPEDQRPEENMPPPWEQETPDAPADVGDEPPVPVDPPPAEQEDVTEKPAERPAERPTQNTVTEPQTETAEPTETSENPIAPSYEDRQPEPREPRMDRWNVAVTIDHFAIMADADGNFLGLRNTEDYTEDEAKEILTGILETGKNRGVYGWLQYCRAEKSYGTLLVITDKTSDQGLLNNLFRLTVVVGILMLLVLLVILIFLSKKITDPVQTAFTRQKQFVSDAGHELKTPIAVLTANADILQDEIGENKWLGYMQEQIGRMNQLVGDLLHLARMDNAAQEYHFEEFDLSLAVAATTLPFESAAFEQHRNLEMDVQPGVIYRGSEQHIRQLCAIFIDNALKYSNENGTIKVTLLKRGEHCILEFYNTGCEISPAETEKIFERFYRGDKARNNNVKNGYGLGLAIAKSIMEVHKIKIQVTCEQGRWIRFLLTM